jgi:hypothetical protein
MRYHAYFGRTPPCAAEMRAPVAKTGVRFRAGRPLRPAFFLSAFVAFFESNQRPSGVFAWSLARGHEAGPIGPKLRSQCLTCNLTIRAFLIEPHRVPCGTAPLRQADDTHNVLKRPNVNAQLVSRSYRFCCLCTLTIDLHLSTRHRLRGNGTCLEKTRRPQPLVDANAVALRSPHDALPAVGISYFLQTPGRRALNFCVMFTICPPWFMLIFALPL